MDHAWNAGNGPSGGAPGHLVGGPHLGKAFVSERILIHIRVSDSGLPHFLNGTIATSYQVGSNIPGFVHTMERLFQ